MNKVLPLIPIVRDFFWNDLLQYVNEIEENAVRCLKRKKITGSATSSLFQMLIIDSSLIWRAVLKLDNNDISRDSKRLCKV
jgi:hypothetical protein